MTLRSDPTIHARLAHLRLAIALIVLGGNLAGCGGPQRTEGTADPSLAGGHGAGPLLPVSAAGSSDFFYEQQILVRWPDGEREFSAVLQKVDDTLSIVALGPMGRPAFRIQLQDGQVTMESFTDRTLPFPPEYIVADVQKAFFHWTEEPVGEFSGTRSTTFESLRVEERYDRGTLEARRFERVDAPDSGKVVVTYAPRAPSLPADVAVENQWFGYSLHVTTTRVATPQ